MNHSAHGFTFFLILGIVGGIVTALAFIAAIQFALPPTDDAYGQGIIATLRDPFVRVVAIPVALLSGLLASPLLFFCLRRRRLAVALPIVFISVILAVAVTTPFSHLLGLFSACAALLLSCIVCARVRATRLEV
jgi:hypothetical protein